MFVKRNSGGDHPVSRYTLDSAHEGRGSQICATLRESSAVPANLGSATVILKRLKKKESAGKPGSVVGSHSSGSCVAAGFKQPTRERRGPRHSSPIWSCSRWGLPCHAALTPHAVRSYRTVSPLPRTPCDAVRRFAFCCTFRRLTPPRRYLAPCPAEPGLSSPCRNTS